MYFLVLLFSVLVLEPFPLFASISFSNQASRAGVADPGEGNGAAFGDYNGDGWPDLLVMRMGIWEHPLLYLNQGDGRFADQSQVLAAAKKQALSGSFVDYDGDGDQDIYIVYYGASNQLFRNDGGAFARIDPPDFLAENDVGLSAVFGDFDGDGAVDLFTTHRFSVSNQFYTRMYAEGFADQSHLISSLRSGRDSFSAVPFDYDDDGDLDIYISNLGFPNLLHRNDGHGLFRQVAEAVELRHPGASVAAFPADYDNDGDLDLYVVNAGEQANVLYRNNGDERFVDVTAVTGTGESRRSLGAGWADFDNDGDLDLIVSNVGGPTLYENNGDGTFADITAAAVQGVSLSEWMSTAGVALADYDLDGDVDVFLAGTAEDLLLRNDSAAQGHWLSLRLNARGKAQTALGARVTIETSAGIQVREYVIAAALGSLHGDLLHFGLGSQAQVDKLTVDWPLGQRQVLKGVGADQVITLRQPLPLRDLRIRTVVRPALAPVWAPLAPEVEVYNAGQSRVTGVALQAQITYGNRSVYSASEPVPGLATGASARVRFPSWTPVLGGVYRFWFELEIEDDVSGNNTWERTSYLYPFRDVAPELGVDDPGKGWAGAFADYDSDGDLDLYVSNGGSLGRGANILYRNDLERGFTDVTEASGTADEGNGTGLVFADFDRDSFLDLLIAKGGFFPEGESNRLFHNNGDGSFSDISTAAGLDLQESSYAPAVGDYDQDGYLDLYVSQLRRQFNRLYHNQGDGTFEDVTQAMNIQSSVDVSGSSAAFADYDNDGDVDLYASVFGGYDLFYSDVGDTSFAVSPVGNERGDSVGIAMGDYDSDGDLDVYVVNRHWRSGLYRNEVDQLFADVSAASGTENFAPGTGCAFGDHDNDGDLDLFVVNLETADRVYMNLGDGTFVDLARAFGMADTSRARGVMLGDYDEDGDLDAYVVNEGARNRLYQNGGSPHNWLKVAVQGVQSNTDGIGARIGIFSEGQALIHEVNGTAGFSQSSRTAHFGLGERDRIDSLVVHWPSGQVDSYLDVVANTTRQVVEGQRPTAVEETSAPVPHLFALEQNHPNPFNAATLIGFSIAQPGRVRLVLYNALGQQIRVLIDQDLAAGRRQVVWDGRDDQGRSVASGAYYYRLGSGGEEKVRSMVLLR